jgi:HEXXH motif-containing protein
MNKQSDQTRAKRSAGRKRSMPHGALVEFSPALADRLLAESLQRNFRDLLVIATQLTPSATKVFVAPPCLSLLTTLDSESIRRLVADLAVIAWADECFRLVRMHEPDLHNSQEWMAGLNNLNLIGCGAALLLKKPFEAQVHFGPYAAAEVPIARVTLRNSTAQSLNVSLIVTALGEIQVDDPRILRDEDDQIQGFRFAFRGQCTQSPPERSYKHLRREECNTALWGDVLTRANDLLEARHRWVELVNHFCKVLAPLEGERDRHVSVSCQKFPKVVFLAESADPLVIAEVLVHESDHNLLYALNRKFAFWNDDKLPYEPVHWSPWRTDARPLDGNLRGASAFTSVSEFLLDVWRSPASTKDEKDIALRRAILSAHQVREALSALGRDDKLFSAAGRAFMRQLVGRIERIMEEFPHSADTVALHNRAIREIALHRTRTIHD